MRIKLGCVFESCNTARLGIKNDFHIFAAFLNRVGEVEKIAAPHVVKDMMGSIATKNRKSLFMW